MNVIKEIERINKRELKAGGGSWHDDYKDSAWVFVGGLNFKMTEGDVITVLSQYGEIEDIHLVREKDTGKSKGFAFVKYEDVRSTVLAVDNFNGTVVGGRILRVDHCRDYREKKAKEGDEEYQRQLEEEEREKKMALDTRNNEAVMVEEEKGEDGRDVIGRELGIDEEDPMRDYLIDKELKKRNKKSKRRRSRSRSPRDRDRRRDRSRSRDRRDRHERSHY